MYAVPLALMAVAQLLVVSMVSGKSLDRDDHDFKKTSRRPCRLPETYSTTINKYVRYIENGTFKSDITGSTYFAVDYEEGNLLIRNDFRGFWVQYLETERGAFVSDGHVCSAVTRLSQQGVVGMETDRDVICKRGKPFYSLYMGAGDEKITLQDYDYIVKKPVSDNIMASTLVNTIDGDTVVPISHFEEFKQDGIVFNVYGEYLNSSIEVDDDVFELPKICRKLLKKKHHNDDDDDDDKRDGGGDDDDDDEDDERESLLGARAQINAPAPATTPATTTTTVVYDKAYFEAQRKRLAKNRAKSLDKLQSIAYAAMQSFPHKLT